MTAFLFFMTMALAGQMFSHLRQPMHSLSLSWGREVKSVPRTRLTSLPLEANR